MKVLSRVCIVGWLATSHLACGPASTGCGETDECSDLPQADDDPTQSDDSGKLARGRDHANQEDVGRDDDSTPDEEATSSDPDIDDDIDDDIDAEHVELETGDGGEENPDGDLVDADGSNIDGEDTGDEDTSDDASQGDPEDGDETAQGATEADTPAEASEPEPVDSADQLNVVDAGAAVEIAMAAAVGLSEICVTGYYVAIVSGAPVDAPTGTVELSAPATYVADPSDRLLVVSNGQQFECEFAQLESSWPANPAVFFQHPHTMELRGTSEGLELNVYSQREGDEDNYTAIGSAMGNLELALGDTEVDVEWAENQEFDSSRYSDPSVGYLEREEWGTRLSAIVGTVTSERLSGATELLHQVQWESSFLTSGGAISISDGSELSEAVISRIWTLDDNDYQLTASGIKATGEPATATGFFHRNGEAFGAINLVGSELVATWPDGERSVLHLE